jgi:hypothetical protein
MASQWESPEDLGCIQVYGLEFHVDLDVWYKVHKWLKELSIERNPDQRYARTTFPTIYGETVNLSAIDISVMWLTDAESRRRNRVGTEARREEAERLGPFKPWEDS